VTFRLVVALVLPLAFSCGCSPSTSAVFDTVRSVARRDTVAATPSLDPRFRYLRVTTQGGSAGFLALGYVDDTPRGQLEVWYSAQLQVLRLKDGRLAGATGVATEWHDVSLPPLPSWRELGRAPAPYRWSRTRDVMPGYRYGVRDTLEIRRIDPPSRSQLAGMDALQLTWFEETSETLPPARYAVQIDEGSGTVVYAEQCLAPELCLSWQRWKAAQ